MVRGAEVVEDGVEDLLRVDRRRRGERVVRLGLVQWLGWAWPYAALVYVLIRVSRSEAEP